MEEPNELMRYGKTFGTSQGTIRWDQAAEGLGCDGFYAEGIEEVESVLEQARKSPRPAVVCLKTDKMANLALPMQLLHAVHSVSPLRSVRESPSALPSSSPAPPSAAFSQRPSSS